LRAGRIGSEWWIACALAVLALLAILADVSPLLRGPAPYPPEWRWDLRAGGTSGRFLPVAAAGLGLVALAAAPARALAGRAAAAVGAATALGLLFHLALLGLEPAGAARTLMDRALSRGATSYLTVAESDAARDPAAFVDRHAELLPGLRRHAATHPPGPVLFYRGLIGLFEAAPGAAAGVLSVAGVDPEGGRRPASVRAAALAGPGTILFLGALAAWPLFAAARGIGLDAVASTRIATLWPLVPAAALMAPQFDQLLALPVTAAAAFLAAAVTAPSDRRHALCAAAAGACAGLACFVSYGAAALCAIAGAAAVLAPVDARRRAAALAITAAAATIVLALPMAWGHEPIAAARTALAIHRETYTRPRSYVTWLAFNPLDLALFLGVPLAALLAARLARAGATGAFGRFRAVLAAGVAGLFLSGAVRGEVGRIALPLMPALLLAAMAPAGDSSDGPDAAEAARAGVLLLALTAAIAVRWAVA
jgi:hypothetical protein